MIAVTSWRVGALRRARSPALVRVSTHQVRESVPAVHAVVAYTLFWVSVAVLVGAWLLLGHEIFHRPDLVDPRALRRLAWCWGAPLLLAAPLGSRDLWAYAAQANVAAHGLNPYKAGPNTVPGVFTVQVTHQWAGLPSPYGPGWVGLTTLTRLILGAHPSLVAEACRVLAGCGLLLLGWTLPILADRLGRRATTTLWAVLANPLLLIDGIAGGHNDLLMTALASAALVIATSQAPLTTAMLGAGAILGAAATIKLPALIALPFLAMIWAHQHHLSPQWRTQLLATTTALASCAATCTAISLLTGFGFRWLTLGGDATHSGGPIPMTLILLATALAWERSRTWNPIAMLTAAALALYLLVPTAEWWYWFLPIALAAPLLTRRLTALGLATISITLLAAVRPDGNSLHLRPELLIATGLLAAWALLDRTPPRTWRTHHVKGH